MVIKIDPNSQEFKDEFKNTEKFVSEVCAKYNFVLNPENEINDSIKNGLTRTQMIYGKKFCPCFMVIGKDANEQENEQNRVCPCVPALTQEIPTNGHCHCAIFCTPEYAKEHVTKNSAIEVSHTHSRGLSKEECEALLHQKRIDGDELESLLEAREIGFVDFVLVDTREWMEYKSKMIVGTDFLVPTSSFYQAISQIDEHKSKNVIVYCFSGSRSEYCQHIMHQMGFANVINLEYGIMTFRGKTARGK